MTLTQHHIVNPSINHRKTRHVPLYLPHPPHVNAVVLLRFRTQPVLQY